MPTFRSNFLHRIQDRGYLYQGTDLESLDVAAVAGPVTAYIGYDCTGPSLHAGHLLSIMALRLFQQTGHRPIVLMGGGTTKIGDPTGKDRQRQLLSDDEIASNMASLKDTFSRYLDFGDGPTGAIMVNNADWLDELEYVPFLREFGSQFSVNRMLSMESVKNRLDREQPLSFLEFNYMVLQAYDFVELGRRYNCGLQMGGSDQWGNIVAGVELGRRVDGRTLFGLTMPLLTTHSGAKMGKTESGAVWLNADQHSAYDFWQYWRDVEDADVGRFLRLFTDLPLDEIARLESLEGQEINDAKKVLAGEVTRLCHGEDAAAAASETARRTFEDGEAGAELPTVEIPKAELGAGVAVTRLLVGSGLCASGGEARRLIRGGGARINGKAVENELDQVTSADVGAKGTVKLSAGKKRHALVRAV